VWKNTHFMTTTRVFDEYSEIDHFCPLVQKERIMVQVTKTASRALVGSTLSANQRKFSNVERSRVPRTGRKAFTTAAAVPPKGVSQPPRSPIVPPPKFGFVDNAEVLNSRAAMIGFFALLFVEGVFGKGLLELAGFTVGKGLDLGL
jgi:hypothetical protein